jgi:hypothetical protein
MMNAYFGRGLRFNDILKDPRKVVKTLLISTSVIDKTHRATYYPYGLILKVPTENIISTSGKDQAFKNYNVFEQDLKDPKKRANFTQLQVIEIRDMQREVRRVASEHTFKTPTDVLKETTGKGGESGYNEITVMGTSPEGKTVEVVGIFIKVRDASGTPYILQGPPAAKEPFVTREIQDLLDGLAKRESLTICQIVDPLPK